MIATKSMLQQIHKLKEYLQKTHDLLDQTHERLTKIVWENGVDDDSVIKDIAVIVDAKKQIEDFKLFNDMEIAKLLQ